jgi:hypothetical protein
MSFVAEALKKVSPAVVRVETEATFSFSDEPFTLKGYGEPRLFVIKSGVFIFGFGMIRERLHNFQWWIDYHKRTCGTKHTEDLRDSKGRPQV